MVPDVTAPLRLPPGPGLPGGLVVPAAELVERFSHSGGPGGQGVNTADSRVQLSLDVATSTAFSDVQRERLSERLAGRLASGTLTVEASEHRSQARNRAAARERLGALLADALRPPTAPRRPTRRSRASVQRRLDAKRRRSAAKAVRRRPTDDA